MSGNSRRGHVRELSVGDPQAALESVRKRAEPTAENDAHFGLDASTLPNGEDRIFDASSDCRGWRLRGMSHWNGLSVTSPSYPLRASRRAIESCLTMRQRGASQRDMDTVPTPSTSSVVLPGSHRRCPSIRCSRPATAVVLAKTMWSAK